MLVDRIIHVRGEKRVVRQHRKKHNRGILLTSWLLKKGTTKAAGSKLSSVVADEDQLREKGREHAEAIQERASKRGNQQAAAAAAAAASGKGKRKGADVALSDPLALAHDGGTRSGATPEASREEQASEERRSSALELIQKDHVLMERVRAMLGASAADQAAAKEAAVNAANTRALRASLQALKRHSNSSIGWTAYTTALATAAGAGEHTCPDPNLCPPGNRCKPAEPGGVSFAERAKSLGIRYETFSDARVRMHNTNHDIAPRDAVSDGCYVYNERKTRSDVTNPEVMALAKAFWHSDDVSRATGNSGKLLRRARVSARLRRGGGQGA
ncbi:unnamed protein product [Ectocarpus sp. CCAP 1310/34]|nr:unnamed protein product [Ectocarpus sp. CCAP 1310/34]CAB1118781.1 unnamed protein product [Ectocarpus sp. CCAP 1310/34]